MSQRGFQREYYLYLVVACKMAISLRCQVTFNPKLALCRLASCVVINAAPNIDTGGLEWHYQKVHSAITNYHRVI